MVLIGFAHSPLNADIKSYMWIALLQAQKKKKIFKTLAVEIDLFRYITILLRISLLDVASPTSGIFEIFHASPPSFHLPILLM